jgi:thiol-disulfide isomerase/thioredoxin
MLVLTVCVVLIFVTATLRSPPGSARSIFYNDFIGRPAIPFALKDLNGREVSLASMSGKVVVLDIWATWCPPCVEELPKLAAVAARYADQGVEFHAINLGDPPEVVRAFVQQQKLNTSVLLDEESTVGQSYNAQYIPLTVVIGRDGRILAHSNLAPDEAEQQLTKWIESALKSGQAS